MVRMVTGGPGGVMVVVGRPGSGKTTALAACREAWEASGKHVVGAALAAEAARNLEREAGIRSWTVSQLTADLAQPEVGGFMPNSVLVVDEAAMVGTRQLAPLLALAHRDGAKVVLVGDDGQLPEIDAGGAFRGLQGRVPTIELRDNRRQRQVWERDALDLIRDGRIQEAIAEYDKHQALVVGDNANEIRRQMVVEWAAARAKGEEPVMVAQRHVDVDALNEQARAMRKESGELSADPAESVEVGGREYTVGDRVVTTHGAAGLKVRNGTRGVVIGVDQDRHEIAMRTDDGVETRLPESYAARGLRHAYAVTGHKVQSKTVSQAFVLADAATYKEWAYVGLSRGVEGNRLYLVSSDRDREDVLSHPTTERESVRAAATRGMARSAAKTMAINHLTSQPEPDATAGQGLEVQRSKLEQAAKQAARHTRDPEADRARHRTADREREEQRDREDDDYDDQ